MKIYSNLKIASIFSIAFLTLACGEDDNPINDVQINDAPTAISSASLSIDNAPFFGPNENVPFNVAVNTASSDIQVLVGATEDFQTNETLVHILSGSTSGNGNIQVPSTFGDLSFDETATYSFEVVGSRLGEIELDQNEDFVSFTPSGEDMTITSSEPIVITLFDQVPTANNAGLNYLMDWRDPANVDLDLEVIDRAFTSIFESSASGSRYESDVFNDANADGDYDFYITIFDPNNALSLADIDVRLFVIDSAGNKTLLELTIPTGTATGSRFPVATFSQTTTPDGVDYSNIVLL